LLTPLPNWQRCFCLPAASLSLCGDGLYVDGAGADRLWHGLCKIGPASEESCNAANTTLPRSKYLEQLARNRDSFLEDNAMQSRRVLSQPLGQLRDEVDRLFTEFVGGLSQFPAPSFVGRRGFPALNIWETPDAVHVEAELPGVDANDLEINVVGKELTLKGQRNVETKEGETYHRRERAVGAFTRLVKLSVEVNPDAVHATLRDGVLQVTLPKAEVAKPRKIAVQIA
jgi:HSP20 family protein